VHDLERRLDELDRRGLRAARHITSLARGRVDGLAGKLDSLSPLGVLGRGYSLTQRAAGGELVRSAGQVAVGEQIVTRLERGRIVSRVETIEDKEEETTAGEPQT